MTRWGLCLRMLCAVALLSLGLAHQPALAAMPVGLELSHYVLPDGSIADLCLNDAVGGKMKPQASGKCEACRIGGGMLLPDPAGFAVAVLAFRGLTVLPPAAAVFAAKRERPGAPPRAPPFLSA